MQLGMLLLLLLLLVVQIPRGFLLLGDSDNYLRDASLFARGDIARSHYSPGFALVLAPILRLFEHNLEAAWNTSLFLNALFAVTAVWFVHRFARTFLDPTAALAVAALIAFNQGAIVYFAHIRPEALTLLLVSAAMVAMTRERDGWAVATLALAVLIRVALAPFAIGLWIVWLRRRPIIGLVGLVTAAMAAAAHFFTDETVQASYLDGVEGTLEAFGSEESLVGGVAAKAFHGVMLYLRYGFPRFGFPFRVLDSPVGLVLAVPFVVVLAVGVAVLLRSRWRGATTEKAVLQAATLGLVAYLGMLLLWPIRDLGAIRLLLPMAGLIAVFLGTGALQIARWLAPRSATRLAGIVLALLVVGNLVSAALLVKERWSQPDHSEHFRVAHVEARDRLAPGSLISSQYSATELLTGRTAYGYQIDNFPEFVEQQRVCNFVIRESRRAGSITPTRQEQLDWILGQPHTVIAESGPVRIVAIKSPWCS